MSKRKTGILIILTLVIFLSVRANSVNYLPPNNLPGFSTICHQSNHANWFEGDHFFPFQLIPLKSIQGFSKTGLPQTLDLQHPGGVCNSFLSGNNFQGEKNYLAHIYHSHHFW
jgi:hypothetical protein